MSWNVLIQDVRNEEQHRKQLNRGLDPAVAQMIRWGETPGCPVKSLTSYSQIGNALRGKVGRALRLCETERLFRYSDSSKIAGEEMMENVLRNCLPHTCPVQRRPAPRKKVWGTPPQHNIQEKLPFPWPQGPKLEKPNEPNAGLRYGSKLLSALQIIRSDVDLTRLSVRSFLSVDDAEFKEDWRGLFGTVSQFGS